MRSFILLILIATLLITGQAVQIRSRRRRTSTFVAPPEPKQQQKPTPPPAPYYIWDVVADVFKNGIPSMDDVIKVPPNPNK